LQEVELSRTRCSSSRYFGIYTKAAIKRHNVTTIRITINSLFQNKTLHQIEYFRFTITLDKFKFKLRKCIGIKDFKWLIQE